MASPLQRIAVTLGDPGGIGPELFLMLGEQTKTWANTALIGYGPAAALRAAAKVIEAPAWKAISRPAEATGSGLYLIDSSPWYNEHQWGRPSAEGGRAAHEALEAACMGLNGQQVTALLTLPIHKPSIQQKNFAFPGHTEYLAAKFDAASPLMEMVLEDFRLALVTALLPLAEVPAAITEDRLQQAFKRFNRSLRQDFGVEEPPIAVLGLNPHAGDDGLLGHEETAVIRPAIERARETGIHLHGPFAADGFFASGNYQGYAGILAMYHDQGLIPFKALTRGEGVNFTAGLPIVRTSPDHGTAFGLAGTGRAAPASSLNALKMALAVATRRSQVVD